MTITLSFLTCQLARGQDFDWCTHSTEFKNYSVTSNRTLLFPPSGTSSIVLIGKSIPSPTYVLLREVGASVPIEFLDSAMVPAWNEMPEIEFEPADQARKIKKDPLNWTTLTPTNRRIFSFLRSVQNSVHTSDCQKIVIGKELFLIIGPSNGTVFGRKNDICKATLSDGVKELTIDFYSSSTSQSPDSLKPAFDLVALTSVDSLVFDENSKLTSYVHGPKFFSQTNLVSPLIFAERNFIAKTATQILLSRANSQGLVDSSHSESFFVNIDAITDEELKLLHAMCTCKRNESSQSWLKHPRYYCLSHQR